MAKKIKKAKKARDTRGKIPNPNKKNVSIDDPDFNKKCNNKDCYVCGEKATKYKKIKCKCKEPDCPVCQKDVPVNVPICDDPECITNLSDTFVPRDPAEDN